MERMKEKFNRKVVLLCVVALLVGCFSFFRGAELLESTGVYTETVEMLDENLRRYDALLQRELGRSFAFMPGAGAAGGMGAGCVALLGGTLKPGIEAILDSVGFDTLLDGADLVITGEGRLDSQSLQGKVVSGVAKRARAKGVPVVALVGDVDTSGYQAYDIGVDAIFSINRLAIPFSQAVLRSPEDYRRTLEDVMRLIRLTKNMN